MVKSITASLPIYFLKCFKCPRSVAHWIEKIQRDVLWNDVFNHKKYNLVRWEVVCKPPKSGGMGVRSILDVNRALLGNGVGE